MASGLQREEPSHSPPPPPTDSMPTEKPQNVQNLWFQLMLLYSRHVPEWNRSLYLSHFEEKYIIRATKMVCIQIKYKIKFVT